MHPPGLELTPPRVLRLWAGLWIVWAVLTTALLATSAWVLSLQIPLRPERSVTGVFVNQTSALEVVLPAGIPLAEVLVGDGERVVAGQHLANLDSAAIVALINQLHAQKAGMQAAMACWRAPEANPPAKALDHKAGALAECINRLQQHRLEREALLARRDRLKRESVLAVRELVLRADSERPPVRSLLKLRAALERETLLGLVRDLEFDLALLWQTQEAERIERFNVLSGRADALSARITTLEGFVDAPWLIAPKEGRIERVRNLAGTAPQSLAQTVAQIQLDAQTNYSAGATLPSAEAAGLEVGTAVQVRLAGAPMSAAPTVATVAQISPLPPTEGAPMSRIEVRLGPAISKAEETLLSQPYGARSNMTIALPAQSFGDVLHSAGKRLWQTF